MKRPSWMRFLAGFHAFPGGALSEQDTEDLAFAHSTLSPQAAALALGDDAAGLDPLGFFVCALRELFEEVGILLAVDGDEEVVVDAAVLEAQRGKLLAEQTTIGRVMQELGLDLATHRIRFHHRWVAPEGLPKRFDVRVFAGKFWGETSADPGEVESIDWHSPGEILGLAEAGEVLLAPPTIATIMSMVPFKTVDELLVGSHRSFEHAIEETEPSIRRLLAPNASVMTGPGTNTYMVGDDELIVIDPGSMEQDHLNKIASSGNISVIVITHSHPDHVSGALDLAALTGAPIAASAAFWGNAGLATEGRRLLDGDKVAVKGVELVVVETPGHASDHICLWWNDKRALFSGDLILGEGTTIISPPDGNLSHYMQSLHRVAALNPTTIYPGHFGHRKDAPEWIAFYIAHRMEREEQIKGALADGSKTPSEIVADVYRDTDVVLHKIAERSVLAHLEKLIGEGEVTQVDGTYSLAHPSGRHLSP
ncbi:MAG: MBL fold metallo-hydrolase [Actinomycetota bacterium]